MLGFAPVNQYRSFSVIVSVVHWNEIQTITIRLRLHPLKTWSRKAVTRAYFQYWCIETVYRMVSVCKAMNYYPAHSASFYMPAANESSPSSSTVNGFNGKLSWIIWPFVHVSNIFKISFLYVIKISILYRCLFRLNECPTYALHLDTYLSITIPFGILSNEVVEVDRLVSLKCSDIV